MDVELLAFMLPIVQKNSGDLIGLRIRIYDLISPQCIRQQYDSSTGFVHYESCNNHQGKNAVASGSIVSGDVRTSDAEEDSAKNSNHLYEMF